MMQNKFGVPKMIFRARKGKKIVLQQCPYHYMVMHFFFASPKFCLPCYKFAAPNTCPITNRQPRVNSNGRAKSFPARLPHPCPPPMTKSPTASPYISNSPVTKSPTTDSSPTADDQIA
jgi:hypothetical protein